MAYTMKKVESCFESARDDTNVFVSCVTKWKKIMKKDTMNLELKSLFELEKLSRCLETQSEQSKQEECKKAASERIVSYLMDFQTNLDKNSTN